MNSLVSVRLQWTCLGHGKAIRPGRCFPTRFYAAREGNVSLKALGKLFLESQEWRMRRQMSNTSYRRESPRPLQRIKEDIKRQQLYIRSDIARCYLPRDAYFDGICFRIYITNVYEKTLGLTPVAHLVGYRGFHRTMNETYLAHSDSHNASGINARICSGSVCHPKRCVWQ